MTAKAPPVPPANRNPNGPGDKGPGDQGAADTDTSLHRGHAAPDPEKQGQAGNTKVNTTHQGYQQDR